MDRKLINPLIVTGIADAVRAKGKTTEPIKVADLPEAIMNLPEGGGVGEDTSALLDAIGVESREDTGMANGLAQALTDSATEQMWSGERSVADGAPIKDGVAFVSTLKGKTMKVNQIVKAWAFNRVLRGVNVSQSSDGNIVISGTATSSGGRNDLNFSEIKSQIVGGHKYLVRHPYGGNKLYFYIENADTFAIVYALSINKSTTFLSPSSTFPLHIGINVEQGAEYNIRGVLQFFDLTEKFGAGNEPTTEEAFANAYGYKSIDDMPPIPYTPTTNLQSFAPKAIVSKGRNLWDEEWEVGAIKDSDGLDQYASDRIRTKGYIPVFPNTAYYGYQAFTSAIYPRFYDKNKNFVGIGDISNVRNKVFTTPPNAYYMRFMTYSSYGNIYRNDICINVSDSQNGTYTPYIAPSRLDIDLTTIVDADGNPLFPDGELKSAGSVCDMVDYANNVAVRGKKVIGRVNLGMLNPYPKAASSSLFAIDIPDIYDSRYLPTTYVPKLICSDSKYIISSQSVWTRNDYQISGNNNATHSILVKNKDCTNIQAMKAALQGVYLDYELAEPIEGEAPMVKSFYPVQSNGAEEAITDTIVPMNAEIRYRVDTESLLTQSASLLRYSNEVTGANDTSLGNAVKTLTDNYK